MLCRVQHIKIHVNMFHGLFLIWLVHKIIRDFSIRVSQLQELKLAAILAIFLRDHMMFITCEFCQTTDMAASLKHKSWPNSCSEGNISATITCTRHIISPQVAWWQIQLMQYKIHYRANHEVCVLIKWWYDTHYRHGNYIFSGGSS